MAREDLLDQRGPGTGHAEDEHRLRARIAESTSTREQLRIESLDDRIDAPDPLVEVELAATPVDAVGAFEVSEGALVVLAIVVHAPERKMQVAAVLFAQLPPFGNRLDPGDGLAVRLAESAQMRQHRPGEGQVGRELQRAPAVAFRRLPVSRDGARVREKVQGGRVVGVEREHPMGRLHPGRDLRAGDEARAEPKPGFDEIRLQRDAAAIALDRHPGLAARGGDLGEHEVVARTFRTQGHRPVRRVLRFCQGSLLPAHQSVIGMRFREPRVLAHECAQHVLRFVEPLAAMKGDREVETRRHMIGHVLQGATETGQGLLDLATIQVDTPQAVPGGNVLRDVLHDLPVALCRRIQIFEIVMDVAELVARLHEPGALARAPREMRPKRPSDRPGP